MTKLENARYDADERVSLFLNSHDTELMTIVLYAVLKTKYFDIFDKITQARLKQIEQTGDLTALKAALKNIMLNAVYKYMLRAYVQAYNLDKVDLATSLDKTMTWLSQGVDNDVADRCTQICNIISDNSATLTVILPTEITEMEDDIKAFKLALAKPKAQIKAKKAEGTDPIPRLLNDLDIIKDKIGKLILSYLPNLYHLWETEIKVGTPTGVRHTSLVIKCVDANTGVPLRKVKATITNGAHTLVKISTKKGYIRFFTLDSDNYTVTIEHETTETTILTDVGIDDQHIARYEVKLQKKKSFVDEIENQTGSFLITTVDQTTGNPVLQLQLTIPSINRTFHSDEEARFFGDDLPPATYDAIISGENIVTKSFTFTIITGQQTELTVPVEPIQPS